MSQPPPPPGDGNFETALEVFIGQLEDDMNTSASGLVKAFPEHRKQIESLILAAKREICHSNSAALPPAPDGNPNADPASRISIRLTAHLKQPPAICLPFEVGDYLLTGPLGSGGMGDVFRATQQRPIQREVAVKLLKVDQGGSELFIRFENERQSLARLNHPNVATILGGGTTPEGRPYLVMELVHGTGLTEYCDRNRLSIRERIELFLKVCAGIQHAHQKGIIHRDIKPSNILVVDLDGVPTPKVIDFGLAKVFDDHGDLESSHTQFGQVLGTLQYMSPEQASLMADRVDTKSDIFSLGILLFELLTGTTPLENQLPSDLPIDERLRRVRQQEPPRPSQRLRELQRASRIIQPIHSTWTATSLRGDLDAVCLRALAPEPSVRYETVATLSNDIQRFLDGRPVLASQPSEWKLLLRYAYRYRWAVGATTAIVTLLLVSGVVSGWLAVRATRAEQLANRRSTDLLESQSATEDALAQAEQSLYVAHINLVQKAVEQKDLQLARNYLNRYDQTAGHKNQSNDLRGFEWFYWTRQLSSYLGECDTGQETFCVRYGPGGQVYSNGTNGEVQVWDPSTRKLLHHFQAGDDMMGVMDLTSDGQRLVTASRDGHVRLWNVHQTKQPLLDLQSPEMMRCAIFDRTDQWILAGDTGGMIRCWRASDGSQVSLFQAHEHDVYDLAVSPDGRLLASAGGDYQVKLWQLPTFELVATLKEHQGRVRSVDFSPDNRLLASGSNDRTVLVWDWESEKVVHQLTDHSEQVYSVKFSPEGKSLATCGRDESIKLWDVASGELRHTFHGHRFTVYDLSFSHDEKTLVSCAHDKTLKFWDLSRELHQTVYRNNTDAIRGISYSQDQQYLASASDDGEIVVQDASDGSIVNRFKPGRSAATYSVFLPENTSRPGKQLAVGFADGWLLVYAIPSGEVLQQFQAHDDYLYAIAVSPDGKQLASSGGDSLVRLWDTSTFGLQKELTGHSGGVFTVAYSPDGRDLVSGDSHATVIHWDTASHKIVKRFQDHTDRISQIVFAPNGQHLASASRDRTIRVYHWKSGRIEHILRGHSASVSTIEFDQDGQTLVSGGTDLQLRFWDLKTGEVKTNLSAHTLPILRVVLSPDGRTLASSSGDATIRLWKRD